MRFRKRAKLFPGVHLNFSKSGISTTIGVPGASINLSKQGTHLNTGIPGTGIYDRKKIGERAGKKERINNEEDVDTGSRYLNTQEEKGAIKTNDAETTTTKGLESLKETLLECYSERLDLKQEIKKGKFQLTIATVLLAISYLLIVGFFVKWFKINRESRKEYLEDLREQLEGCYVNIDMEVDGEIEDKYLELLDGYKTLLTCSKIWDITSALAIDRKKTRSAASTSVTRKLVKFGFSNIDIIKCRYDALHFENANGGQIYIYPAFIAIVDSRKKFGLVDIRELDFSFHRQRFVEEERVPPDAEVVDETWAKVNKNGSRDKRFKDNYRIPICLYGEFTLTSKTGLNEAYSLSSYKKCENFAQTMINYQKMI